MQCRSSRDATVPKQPHQHPNIDAHQWRKSSRLREKRLQQLKQRTKTVFDHAPDNLVVHSCVPVDQDVAKADDARKIGNRRCHGSIDAPELVEGFAEDLEL